MSKHTALLVQKAQGPLDAQQIDTPKPSGDQALVTVKAVRCYPLGLYWP